MNANTMNAVTIDGINYKLNENFNTASVINNGKIKYQGNIKIPSNITYEEKPYKVTIIDDEAFSFCNKLTSITIPESIEHIGYNAFQFCPNLSNVYITNLSNWCNISFYNIDSNPMISAKHLFLNETELRELNIPEDVTEIKKYTFYNCKSLTRVFVPGSVKAIQEQAFHGCTELEELLLSEGIDKIGDEAFYGCTKLEKVNIPSSVSYIGNSTTGARLGAFIGCNNLRIVTIKSNVLISNYDGRLCNSFGTQVKEYILNDNLTDIASYKFSGCTELESIIIPNTVTSIGGNAFQNCTKLSSINIPTNVSQIGWYAFAGCNNIQSIVLPDNIEEIGPWSFPDDTKLYTNKGSLTLLQLWRRAYKPYLIDSERKLDPPSLNIISITQTTIHCGISNVYDEYNYYYKGSLLKNYEIKESGLYPGESIYPVILVCPKSVQQSPDRIDQYYVIPSQITTNDIYPKIISKTTASSVTITGTYIHEDASVIEENIKINNNSIIGNQYKLNNLEPNSNHIIEYTLTVEVNKDNKVYKKYSIKENIKTESIVFKTQQPKVISIGNVIVQAQSNLDNDEEKVGFEWRRIDWSDDFQSNSGQAYLYEGTMEGYIRNLNTEKLWKYRPYYDSGNDNRYYGQWVGIDPTNSSYFEPTVHTYESISIEGNTATVHGYVQRGTDNIYTRGFKYWTNKNNSRGYGVPVNIPKDAKTIEANGTVMEADLKNLVYDAEYSYVAYATTSEGETFYGDVRSFCTGPDPSEIKQTRTEDTEVVPTAYYDLLGRRYKLPQPGMNIIRMSDGTTRKILMK